MIENLMVVGNTRSQSHPFYVGGLSSTICSMQAIGTAFLTKTDSINKQEMIHKRVSSVPCGS